MNRTLTIGLFAGIFAIAIGAISLSGESSSAFMVSATPKTQESMGMIGHVEYIVRDELDQIKSYTQTDNVVTEQGKNCVAQILFDQGETVEDCGAITEFQYIAIGNDTNGVGDPDGTEQNLDRSGAGCANTTDDGEMTRRLVDPTFITTGADTQVVLDTSTAPFKFGDNNATNTTTVFQSGIFNADNTRDPTHGHCTTVGTADLFAIQNLNGIVSGISVTSGDSLSVKWTITVGST